jgi:hypothetical protein
LKNSFRDEYLDLNLDLVEFRGAVRKLHEEFRVVIVILGAGGSVVG